MCLRSSNEVFGICPLPHDATQMFGHQHNDATQPVRPNQGNKKALLFFQYCIIPHGKCLSTNTWPLDNAHDLPLYQCILTANVSCFLASTAGYSLEMPALTGFDLLLCGHRTQRAIPFFNKTPESLKSHLEACKRGCNVATTLRQHSQTVQATNRRIQAASRGGHAPAAINPVPLRINSSAVIIGGVNTDDSSKLPKRTLICTKFDIRFLKDVNKIIQSSSLVQRTSTQSKTTAHIAVPYNPSSPSGIIASTCTFGRFFWTASTCYSTSCWSSKKQCCHEKAEKSSNLSNLQKLYMFGQYKRSKCPQHRSS
ncbi:hypothetical protein BGW37DRAFT_464857 [Umbelopsis sp. PMI_123]|nr:hypothetical protein BGW37DRAFT_464857 [Umbelopsis sp. PMI_123]